MFVVALALLAFAACSSTKNAIIPLTDKAEVEDTYTLIWNGVSQAYRYTDTGWLRAPNYDYVFDVVQKRYHNEWKSTKSLHRLHARYDGRAGARDQTMYFELAFNAFNDGKVVADIKSSLGDGTGSWDAEFREQQLVMYVKDASMFMPYNKVRITQHYNYEEGLLTETVELLKEDKGHDTPFMKNEERAYIYTKSKLTGAPTTYVAGK